MSKQFPLPVDVLTAMKNSKVFLKPKELENGSIIQKAGRTILYSGGYSMVFPYKKANGDKVAVRCWVADIGEAKKRTQVLSDHLNKLNSAYFVKFRYIDNAILINGTLNPVVIMDWVEGQTIKDFLNDSINDKARILSVADKFKAMVAYFHKVNIAHGDLQHGNILVTKTGELVSIDYDSMYVQDLKGLPDNVKGLPGYQHPARQKNPVISEKLDYFSELVIYLSLLVYAEMPKLWNKYKDTEDLLFSKEDFIYPYKSALLRSLSRSANRQIADLTSKMTESLVASSIDELVCLEEMLIDKRKVTIEHIFEKLDNQSNPPDYRPVFSPIGNILSKF